MPVSIPTMTRLLGRMTAAMGKPFSDAKVEAQATEYARAMGNLPEYAVEWAVERTIKDSDKYPKASTLRKLAHTCPHLANGNHDNSLRAQMRRWEQDPWAEIDSLSGDGMACTSTPCPVCQSVIVFSHRGAVIVHADQPHTEAQVSYSNLGRAEWLTMGRFVPPERPERAKPRTPNPYPTLESRQPTPIQAIVPKPSTPDDAYDLEQQRRAEESAA